MPASRSTHESEASPPRRPASPRPEREPSLEEVRAALAGSAPHRELLVPLFSKIPEIVQVLLARRRIFLQADDLEDLTQDCMALTWRKLVDFEGRSTLLTYVWKICDLELRNGLRRIARARGAPLEGGRTAEDEVRVDPDQVEESPSFVRSLERLDLEVGLARLPQDEYAVLRLRHFDNQTFEQIAQARDSNVHRVKALHQRALLSLYRFFRASDERGEG